MTVHSFFKTKIFSKKLDKNHIYLFSSLLFILVIGALVAIVTFGTIQQGKTQTIAAADPKLKYDPIVAGKQLIAGLEKNLIYEIAYDTNAQTADVVRAEEVYGEIFLPLQDSAADVNKYYSFKLKVKDKDQKAIKETWLNYKKSVLEKDKNSGKIKLYVLVPDRQDLQFEFADRGGKNLINKPFGELSQPNKGLEK